MAAGLGFKDFVTGEVLTSQDVDGYLMQGVWVFASAAARDAAVTSPQEGNFAYLKDTNVTTYYTGSAWANLDTTGMTNPMTTTGDTIYSSSGSTPARLGIGSTGQVLTVASGVPSWATPASGGASGLTKITTLNPSAVSETIADSVFSSTYDNYLIVGYLNLSGNANLQMELRSSGTNLQTNTYTSSQFGVTSVANQWYLSDNVASNKNFMFTITLAKPFLAQLKQGTVLIARESAASYQEGISEPTATSRDGFRIYPSTGTITGQIVVYGLAE